MAKYICLVILVVVHAVTAVPVPVALKKDAPKYSSDHDNLHQEESLRSPRSTATVPASGAVKDATPAVAGTEVVLPDSLTNQLKKLKEQVELYQMINDMLKAETKVQAMPYTVDQDEPHPTQQVKVAAAPATATATASHNDQARHEDHQEESQHDDQDYHTEDDHHHNDDHHEDEHHEPQEYGKRQMQQRYHH